MFRKGKTLKHKCDHKKEHLSWSRRDFIRNSGLVAGAGMVLNNMSLSAYSPSPLLAALNQNDTGNILVLIRLQGGNDGLSTIVPVTNDLGNSVYHDVRPTLGLSGDQLLDLDNNVALNSAMDDVFGMWNNNDMAVINSVGYPSQNYSHFRSSDIWASSSHSEEVIRTGWLGRFLDNDYPTFLETPPIVPPALQIGIETNLIFKAHESQMALAISNPTEFYQIAQSGELFPTNNLGTCAPDLELQFLRQTANNAFRYAESIKTAYNNSTNLNVYPTGNDYGRSGLDEQLRIVSRMIKGNLGTKIYMVSIGGFDTHADQAEIDYDTGTTNHDQMLKTIAGNVNAFFQDLAEQEGLPEKVVAMTFSEFGRTVHENDSQGTDHGTSAPMLFFGPSVIGGVKSEHTDLNELDEYDDMFHTTDFRSVYATTLEQWLCIDGKLVDHVLGETFERIPNLFPACESSQGANDVAALLGYNPDPENPNIVLIKYAVQHRGIMRMRVLNRTGQPIRTLFAEERDRGSHTFSFNKNNYNLSAGKYMIQLDSQGHRYERPFNIK